MANPANGTQPKHKMLLTDKLSVRRDFSHTDIVSAYDQPATRKAGETVHRPDAVDLQSSIAAVLTKLDS